MSVNAEHVKRLRQKVRGAVNICAVGKCGHCRKQGQLFYTTDYDYQVRNGRDVVGGFWCPHCNFGNAGSLELVEFESAEKVDGTPKVEAE